MSYWQVRETAWWETNVINCALCGQMIPRAVWVSEEGLSFCGPACEKLYRTYWLPTHGPTPPTAGTVGTRLTPPA